MDRNSFLGQKGALGMMSKYTKGTKKYVRDVEGTMVENIFYFFEPQGVLGAFKKPMMRMTSGDDEKGSQNYYYWGNMGYQKWHWE